MFERLGNISATQRRLVLLLVGALASLAFAPYEFFFVLLISFPVFFKIIQTAKTRKQAFGFGWFFGFGHFVAGVYWIPNSLLVEGAEHFAWLIPFAAMGIPAVLAIYIGLMSLAFYSVCNRFKLSGAAQIIIFANFWLIAEFARAYMFTGFPWNLLGYSLLFNQEIAQVASIGGVFLCSLFAVFASLSPLYIKDKKMLAVLLLLVVGAYAYGAYRIENTEVQSSGKTVKLLQPNHEQKLYADPIDKRERFEDSLALMGEGEDADYYVWAEATGVYPLNRSPEAVDAIASVLPDGALAIVGSDRSNGYTVADYQVWNSAYVVSKKGVESVYDKQHLVPFGEYVPLSGVLPLEKITEGMIDFSSGKGEKRLKLGELSAIPLICYEVVFSDYVRYEGVRPDFIVNITNDSWFGDSSGPYQHLAMAKMRAIESGLPVVRAAKTGVSAVVDSFGAVLANLGLNQRGVVFLDIPDRAIYSSLYLETNLLMLIIILVSASIIVFFRKK